MKVLHIIWSSNIGGIESVVLNLAIAQQSEGTVKPTLYAAKSEGPLIEKAKDKKIEIIQGDFKSGRSNIARLNLCIDLFKKFDILHLHSFNPIIALAAAFSKKKIVFTEHGNFAFERKERIMELISKKLQQIFLKKFIHHITYNSNFSKKTAIAKYQLPINAGSVIYNGIDLPPFNDDEKTPSDKLRIGFVGRLVEVKRVDRLIQSIAAIKNRNDVSVELIGDGPLKQNIIAQITDTNLNDTVRHLGFKEDIYNYYNEWDLLIAPSVNEAFGLVAIEAYSHGCAVAVFNDGGGLVEIVERCEPEMVFNTTTELSTFIASLIAKTNVINATKQRKHRKEFAQQFSIAEMETAIKQVYLSL